MTVEAAIFPTAIGACGVAWTAAGLRAVQLPEAKDTLVMLRLRERFGARAAAELPPLAVEAIRRLQAHLEGRCDPLRELPLDLDRAPPFTRLVYEKAREVSPGQTTTYGELARGCGRPGAARAVGQAMAQNPLPLIVPCHRVLGEGGALGGFSAHGAAGTKLRLLTLEGADLSRIAAAGTRELGRREPRLRALIRRVGELRLHWAQREDRFTALAEAIVHQQVSMAAGATIFKRVLALAGGEGLLDATRLLAAAPEELRAAGLSRQKASYLLDLAARTRSGELALSELDRLGDEQVIECLTRVKGIGRWSAEMFLIFRLGRLDVLPVDDLGLRRGVQLTFGLRTLPAPRRVRELGEAWRPFRSIATWYLWRSLQAGGLSG